jgi:hypothetical protein
MASLPVGHRSDDVAPAEVDRQHCVIRPIPSKVLPQPHFMAHGLNQVPHYQWKATPAPWLQPILSYYDWMVAAASLSAAAAAASSNMIPMSNAAFPFPVESMTQMTNSNENSPTEAIGRMESTSMDFDEDETISVENTDSEDSDDLRIHGNVLIETSTETDALEVAACDGPIRFQRIVNPATTESEEEDPPQAGEARSDKHLASPASTTYRCLFCNHTFKSHYCYQKHKRRHLNPAAVDFETAAENDEAVAEKRHPAIRDINVQFFPCKICGAKFPSYYFVHKHKKMWHSAELEEEKLRGVAAAESDSIPETQMHT